MTTVFSRRTLFSLATLGVFAIAGCGPSGELSAADSTVAAKRASTAVVLAAEDVATATTADVTTGVTLTGSLEPAEKVTVTAQVGGTMGPIRVDRGSSVTRGQELTTIQAVGVQSQVAGARANVAAAEANLAVALTQRDAAKRLYEAGATSLVDYQNVQAAYAASEAQLAAARAQAASAGEAAGYTSVVAPISGIISARPSEPGQAVRPGDEIVSHQDRLATLAKQPDKVRADIPGAAGDRGTVARKDPAADPSTRQVGVFIRLPNPNREITAGQYARGQVSGRVISGAVTVPQTAVQGSGDDAAVFVIAGNVLSRRTVTLGARDDRSGRVVIESGLEAGERVLMRPTATMADGQPVTVSTDQSKSSSEVTPASPESAVPADTTRES